MGDKDGAKEEGGEELIETGASWEVQQHIRDMVADVQELHDHYAARGVERVGILRALEATLTRWADEIYNPD